MIDGEMTGEIPSRVLTMLDERVRGYNLRNEDSPMLQVVRVIGQEVNGISVAVVPSIPRCSRGFEDFVTDLAVEISRRFPETYISFETAPFGVDDRVRILFDYS